MICHTATSAEVMKSRNPDNGRLEPCSKIHPTHQQRLQPSLPPEKHSTMLSCLRLYSQGLTVTEQVSHIENYPSVVERPSVFSVFLKVFFTSRLEKKLPVF
jgi:hypothetical protein